MSRMANFAIITVNYNTKEFVTLCIKSIYTNTEAPFKFIVVDNGSLDGSVKYLTELMHRGKIILISRRVRPSAFEHGKAIDHVLYNSGLIKTGLVCTIDSDAYVAKKGWLTELNKQRGNNFAAGYEHFRNAHYLHPACMLFDYQTILKIGRPSFALTNKGGKFLDTGVVVSQTALENKCKLIGVRGIEKLVPHRWCATRILKLRGDDKLDGRITKGEFDAETRRWFSRPDVAKIMSIKL